MLPYYLSSNYMGTSWYIVFHSFFQNCRGALQGSLCNVAHRIIKILRFTRRLHSPFFFFTKCGHDTEAGVRSVTINAVGASTITSPRTRMVPSDSEASLKARQSLLTTIGNLALLYLPRNDLPYVLDTRWARGGATRTGRWIATSSIRLRRLH
jgi:hypothetical protein